MAAKHDLSTKSASPNDTATEIVNVKKGNIDDITLKTTSLLEIGDKIHLLTNPSSANTTAGSITSS